MHQKIGIGNSAFKKSIKPRFTEKPIKLFETFQEILDRNERGTPTTDLGRSGTLCSDCPASGDLVGQDSVLHQGGCSNGLDIDQ